MRIESQPFSAPPPRKSNEPAIGKFTQPAGLHSVETAGSELQNFIRIRTHIAKNNGVDLESTVVPNVVPQRLATDDLELPNAIRKNSCCIRVHGESQCNDRGAPHLLAQDYPSYDRLKCLF